MAKTQLLLSLDEDVHSSLIELSVLTGIPASQIVCLLLDAHKSKLRKCIDLLNEYEIRKVDFQSLITAVQASFSNKAIGIQFYNSFAE